MVRNAPDHSKKLDRHRQSSFFIKQGWPSMKRHPLLYIPYMLHKTLRILTPLVCTCLAVLAEKHNKPNPSYERNK